MQDQDVDPTEMYIPLLPSKPAHMSKDAWEQSCIVPHCVRLISGECKIPCALVDGTNEYSVQCDHIVPKSCGGKDKSGNYQWLCKGVNQRKHASMDPVYKKQSWFDLPFEKDNLRKTQEELAWNKILEYGDVFASMRDEIFAVFFLLAWVVGGGKTVGNLAVLFAINHCINRLGPGRKRINKALFLVHQRELVDALCSELLNDPVTHGIVARKPRIIKIKCQSDWNRVRTGDYDIAVACTQAIWVPDAQSKVMRLSDDELAAKLAIFEAVIVDECHFAPERWLHLIRLMPKAFKIASTATPMDGEGMFLSQHARVRDRLVILSTLTYDEARENKYLKEVLPFDEGILEGKYVCITGGKSVEVERGIEREGDENNANPNNLVQLEAMFARAAVDMLEDDKVLGFSSHAIIKSASIEACNDVACRINSGLSGKIPAGLGFKCAVLHSGESPIVDGRRTAGLDAWMVAKNNGGIATKDSCRFLSTVQVGQFGLNNRTCCSVLYADATESVVDIIQRIGRAMRGSEGTVRVYYRRADQSRFEPKLKESLEYLLDMETKLKDAGFLWIDDWAMQTDSELDRPVSVPILTDSEKIDLQKAVGKTFVDNVCDDDEFQSRIVDFIGCRFGASVGDDKKAEIERYASVMRNEGELKKRALGVPVPMEPPKTSVVVRDEPPSDYQNARLIEAVRAGVIPSGDSVEKAINAIASGDYARSIFVQYLREHEAKYYEPPRATKTLNEACKSLAAQIGKSLPGFNYPAHIGKAVQAVNIAVAYWFGLPNVQKSTIEQHEAHYVSALSRWQHRKPITGVAKAILIDRIAEAMPEVAALWKTISEETLEAVGEVEASSI